MKKLLSALFLTLTLISFIGGVSALNYNNFNIEPEFHPLVTVTKSANYTATTSDSLINVNAATGTITITLPSISSVENAGYVTKSFKIKKTDTTHNIVSVVPASGNTIEDVSAYVVTKRNDFITLYNDSATNWRVDYADDILDTDVTTGQVTAGGDFVVNGDLIINDLSIYGDSTLSDLNDAVSDIGSTTTTLAITTVATMSGNLTIPANITLFIAHGGLIDCNSTYTLTINGIFNAGRYNTFDNCDSLIVFGDGSILEVYPEWWGFTTSATSTPNKTALESAIDSIVTTTLNAHNAGKIKFGRGAYPIDSGIVLDANTENLTFEGVSGFSLNLANDSYPQGTFLQCQGSGTCIDATASNVVSLFFRDIRIGHKSGTGTQPDYILEVGSDFHIQNSFISGAGIACVHATESAYGEISNSIIGYTQGFSSVGDGLLFKTGISHTTFKSYGNKYRQANVGVNINNGSKFSFNEDVFEANDAEGMKIRRGAGQATKNITVSNSWFEANYWGGTGSPAGYEVDIQGDATNGNVQDVKFDNVWFVNQNNQKAHANIDRASRTKFENNNFATGGYSPEIVLGSSAEDTMFLFTDLSDITITDNATGTIRFYDNDELRRLSSNRVIKITNVASSTKSANYTLNGSTDVGRTFYVDTNGVVLSLPATVVGITYTFVNDGNDALVGFNVSPTTTDKIIGAGSSGTDNKDIINTQATAKRGDTLKIIADGVDGWYIQEMYGTWDRES